LAVLLTPIKTGRHFIVAISVWLIEICWPLFGVNKNTQTVAGGFRELCFGFANTQTSNAQPPTECSLSFQQVMFLWFLRESTLDIVLRSAANFGSTFALKMHGAFFVLSFLCCHPNLLRFSINYFKLCGKLKTATDFTELSN